MKTVFKNVILFLGGAAIGAVGKDIYESNKKPIKAPKQPTKTTSKAPTKKSTKKVK